MYASLLAASVARENCFFLHTVEVVHLTRWDSWNNLGTVTNRARRESQRTVTQDSNCVE